MGKLENQDDSDAAKQAIIDCVTIYQYSLN